MEKVYKSLFVANDRPCQVILPINLFPVPTALGTPKILFGIFQNDLGLPHPTGGNFKIIMATKLSW